VLGGAMALAVFAAGCSNGGGGATPGAVQPNRGNAQIVKIEYGRLVDVYGLDGIQITLFQEDVLVGPDIQDERPAGSNVQNEQVLYDFIGANPDTLQDRLFIPRELGSAEFNSAFAALDDKVRLVSPGYIGQNVSNTPFSVVPRNAGIRVTFSESLGITDDFFVSRDANGAINGIKNTEAVQLLEVQGDPTQPGGFQVIPTRVAVRANELFLDTVLLGSEGRTYNTQNNATGMPRSPDQLGANIRLAIALDGPLRIPGVRADATGGNTIGLNNSGVQSVIRDFRSGNDNDTSSDISRGFIRDPIPPRVVGEIVMYLERVVDVSVDTQEITIFKGGVNHELDQGDVFNLVVDSSGSAVVSTEIVVDPEGDRGQPNEQHVTVLVRREPGLAALDPRNLQGYPVNGTQAQIEEFLVANGPRAILSAEFTGSRVSGGVTIEDDPRYFITFAPTPLLDENGMAGEPNEFVSPFAAAVIRFTKPVDLDTVKPLDTFFFATRDLVDETARQQFISQRGLDPATFNEAKYRTPHLVAARVFDEGSQTALRLQTPGGFFLDDQLRDAATPFNYYLHLLSGTSGIRDLSGNPVDLQSNDPAKAQGLVIPFTIDTRRSSAGQPFFPDNLVVSIARRFADQDEDGQPSYYMPREADPNNASTTPGVGYAARSQPLEDLFGGFFYTGTGAIEARPASRTTKIADNLNQQPVQSQESDLRWCPWQVGTEQQVAANTANTLFGQGIQNPLNPYGSRLQTVWREIDLSLSRVNADDFNLDIEQMYWAPFTGSEIVFDEFDQLSLFLGHSERRPEPCVGQFSALPELPASGLGTVFDDNYVFNPGPSGTGSVDSRPDPHPAYVDKNMVIDANLARTEPNGINRFLPLPEFDQPYFIYRDETVIEQGGVSGEGSDLTNGRNSMQPFIVSPFMAGKGRKIDEDAQGELRFQTGLWDSTVNYELHTPPGGATGSGGRQTQEFRTGGLVGTVALPLLADFWTFCDRPDLPAGSGYVALGVNGWQIAITVTSGPQPNFRVYSAGRPSVNGNPSECVEPGTTKWGRASGGFTLTGSATASGDNSFYWIWIDFLKRQTVVTNGFVDIRDPHRVYDFGEVDPTLRTTNADPRLGPYLTDANGDPITGYVPRFINTAFEPELTELAGGTSIAVEYRGATAVDPQPWKYWEQNEFGSVPQPFLPYLQPTRTNFALDPLKAGDAHIRKFDERSTGIGGVERDWWTHYYNRTVTSYVGDPNSLFDPAYLLDFQGPNDSLVPEDIVFFNWRFIMINNNDAQPPVSPRLESFATTYRFDRNP